MIYGAILAGGIGKRVERYSIPKQFIPVGGVPIIVRTLRRFLENTRINVVYIAVHADWIPYANNLFANSFSKDELSRMRVVSGGKERIDSFINILNDISQKAGIDEEDILICHDTVRPFVSQQMIDDCIDYTMEHGLALTVVPVNDTVFKSSDGDFIDGTLDRRGLFNGQTPSGFNAKLLYNACAASGEDDKNATTGTMQLMLQLGNKIKVVKGHTSNFKITTDNDLDVAERIVRGATRGGKIELLDCTLRDGGIVIDFNFGSERIQKIKRCLEYSGVDFIECGYIDRKKGSFEERTCFDNEKSIKNTVLSSGKKDGIKYVAMIDYGTYDLRDLGEREPDGIDGIRFAFHKENWKDAVKSAKTILEKGYELYIQPMVTLRYSDEEFRELISVCNKRLAGASGIYIVDSFGQMDNMALAHMLEIADEYVSPSMKIGFHAHNNRQMAFSNACAFVNFPAKHSLMIDSSIMGMGKGAGNLCTELIMPILIAQGNVYGTSEIYDQISEYFAEQMKNTPWGYCLDYYLSSLYGCTPSYIKIFTGDKRVSTDILIELLKSIPEDKRSACDKDFAKKLLEDRFT